LGPAQATALINLRWDDLRLPLIWGWDAASVPDCSASLLDLFIAGDIVVCFLFSSLMTIVLLPRILTEENGRGRSKNFP
jgi:hypothetical protein